MRPPFLLLLLPLTASLASCSSCSKKSDGAELAAPVLLAPVAAPDGLLGEMTIANPDAFWGHLQRGTGGLVALLPMTLGGLVTTFGTVDASVATTIDGASPAYAAAVAHGADDIGWAIAVKLTDLPHARAILIDGEAAHYDGHDEDIWTLLSRKGGNAPSTSAPPQIAISKNGELVIADSLEDLKAVGPYLVRTMPTRPRGAADVDIDLPHAALAGPLHDRLLALWTQTRQEKETQAKEAKDQHGRDADFADPSAILTLADGAVQKRLALLPDLQSTHISISADATSLTVDATLVPGEGAGPTSKWIEGLPTGDATPILDAPSGVFSLMLRSSDPDPKSAATDFESALKSVLGARLNEGDAKLAHAAASDWSSGSGKVTTASLRIGGAPGVLVATPAATPEALARAAHEGCELLDRPAFRAPLKSLLGVTSSSFATAQAAGGGAISTFALQRGADDFVSAAWYTHDGNFSLGVSADGSKFLGSFATDSHRWRADPAVLARATALGAGISVAIAARPFPASDPDASLFFAWGRDGKSGHASLETSDVAVREAIRLFAR